MSEPDDRDHALAEWLAGHGGGDVADVERELELGESRRMFVVDELIESGYSGASLLEMTMRLTGLDEKGAARLIAERQAGRPRH